MKNKFCLLVLFVSLIILPNSVSAQEKDNQIKDIAIQLYSVRDRIGSFNTTTDNYRVDYTVILKELAQMGYTGVEAAGYTDGNFYGRSPEQFKKDVEGSGLKVLSSQ